MELTPKLRDETKWVSTNRLSKRFANCIPLIRADKIEEKKIINVQSTFSSSLPEISFLMAPDIKIQLTQTLSYGSSTMDLAEVLVNPVYHSRVSDFSSRL